VTIRAPRPAKPLTRRAVALTTTETAGRGDVALSLAHRAIELARDVRTPSTDGVEHLVRLAMGRRETLAAALAELERKRPTTEVVCAHLLLDRAIDVVEHRR
jgi:hypothetical protein